MWLVITGALLFERLEFKSCLPVWPQAGLVSLVILSPSVMRTIAPLSGGCSESTSGATAPRIILTFIIHVLELIP